MSAPRPHRTRTVVATAAALWLSAGVLAGCSSSGASSNPTTTAAAATTTTPPQPSTTPPRTVPAQATVGYPSSYDAVQHLIDAWTAGDRTTAAQGADATAVNGMWETPPGELDQRGCAQTYEDPDITEGGCILRRADQTGALQVNTERRAIGWVVSSAIYSPN